MKRKLHRNFNKERKGKYYFLTYNDYNDYHDFNKEHYLTYNIHCHDDNISLCWSDRDASTIEFCKCSNCNRLCSYIYGNLSLEVIKEKIIYYIDSNYSFIDKTQLSNLLYKMELKNINLNNLSYLSDISFDLACLIKANDLLSYYYSKCLNIEKGCYICRCEICNYPLNIYEESYLLYAEYDNIFIKCIMCDKLKKYIKNSCKQINILKNLNTNYYSIFKDIKYNKSYYDISDFNENILLGIKKNIFIDFIEQLKYDNNLYIEYSYKWKRKQKQKRKRKYKNKI